MYIKSKNSIKLSKFVGVRYCTPRLGAFISAFKVVVSRLMSVVSEKSEAYTGLLVYFIVSSLAACFTIAKFIDFTLCSSALKQLCLCLFSSI